MITFDLYIRDLSYSAQKRICKLLGDNKDDYALYPLLTLTFEGGKIIDPNEPIIEYDSSGYLIRYIDSDKYKSLTDEDKFYKGIPVKYYTEKDIVVGYDENGNTIHVRHPDGFESWTEYDSDNRNIHCKESTGFESWTEYENDNRNIHYKESSGFESWTEYNDEGKVLHSKNPNGYECWRKYNKDDKLINHRDSDNYEVWYKYDDAGREIHYKNSNGYEELREYDVNDKLVLFKRSKANE